MDALILFGLAVFVWTSPLMALPLLERCPPKQVEFWLGVLVVSSWIGFAVYLWRYYWQPDDKQYGWE